jgi:hypothetical protein
MMFDNFLILALPSGTASVQNVEVESPFLDNLLTLYPRLSAQINKGHAPRTFGPHILPSPFRPKVPSIERIFFWVSPSSLIRRRQLCSRYSPFMIEKFDSSLRGMYADGTLSSYGSGLINWIQWCDKCSIPEDCRLPINLDDLRMFIAFKDDIEGVAKTNNTLSGLRAWHIVQDVTWNADDELVAGFCRSIASHAPQSSFLPPRPPVTLLHLRTLRAHLDITKPFDSAVFALACVCFWGVCRLGELTSPGLRDTQPTHRVLRDCRLCVPWWTISFNPRQTIDFHLPWTKTTRTQGGDVHLSEWDDCIDISAPRALSWHLRCNWSVPSSAPLFAYASNDLISWTPMTKSAFMSRCRSIWALSNLGDCSGHSFCIGGTTELLKCGVSHDAIKIQGRWASEAWTRYIRNHPEIEYDRVR